MCGYANMQIINWGIVNYHGIFKLTGICTSAYPHIGTLR